MPRLLRGSAHSTFSRFDGCFDLQCRPLERGGILAHGFLRVRCAHCAHEKLVAFSCKRRGFCPSCGARRMAESAAHLVDEVIPQVRFVQKRRACANLRTHLIPSATQYVKRTPLISLQAGH